MKKTIFAFIIYLVLISIMGCSMLTLDIDAHNIQYWIIIICGIGCYSCGIVVANNMHKGDK